MTTTTERTSENLRALLRLRARLVAAAAQSASTELQITASDLERLGQSPRLQLIELGFVVTGGAHVHGDALLSPRRYFLMLEGRQFELTI